MIQLEQCRSSPKVITRSINTKGVLDLQTKMIWGKCLQRMLLHTPWSIQAKMTWLSTIEPNPNAIIVDVYYLIKYL